MLKLRYHHGLCLLNFVGKGYNERFVENLKDIKNRNDSIEWVSECDDICELCPHQIEHQCEFENPNEMDQRVKQYFINPSRNDLINLNQNKYKEICEGCEWYYFCEGIRKR